MQKGMAFKMKNLSPSLDYKHPGAGRGYFYPEALAGVISIYLVPGTWQRLNKASFEWMNE